MFGRFSEFDVHSYKFKAVGAGGGGIITLLKADIRGLKQDKYTLISFPHGLLSRNFPSAARFHLTLDQTTFGLPQMGPSSFTFIRNIFLLLLKMLKDIPI